MAARTSGDGQGVMVSNLPLLFTNGNPTSLSAMSGVDLQYFIPFLIKCAMGQEPKFWETSPKPYWWPDDVPYSQQILRPGYANEVWTGKFRVLVNNCYIHHGCKYLLDFSAYLRDCVKKGVVYQKNHDGTTSMFEANGGKLLVTFRDENREYDVALRRAPVVNMTAVPSLPPQLATPQLLANLQRATTPYRAVAPQTAAQQTAQQNSTQRWQVVPPLVPAPNTRPVQARPPVKTVVPPRGQVPIQPQKPTASVQPQSVAKGQLTPQQQLQLLLNRPDLAIRPVGSSSKSSASVQLTPGQQQVQPRLALASKLQTTSQMAPAGANQRIQAQRTTGQNLVRPSTSQSGSISQEVAAALQRKLSSVSVRPKVAQKQQQHVPQNVAHILKSLQENMGDSVTIQVPGKGISISSGGPSNPPNRVIATTAVPGTSAGPSTSSAGMIQVTSSVSTQFVQKDTTPKTTPKKSPVKQTPSRPTLLPKLSKAGCHKDDIVDIYLCDFCDQQFTSLPQTKIHEATCKAKQTASQNKAMLRQASVLKEPEPDVIEIKGDNQPDFLKCFGLVQKDKFPKGDDIKNRRFVPKIIDEAPRKLFLAHQTRHINIPLSCSMGRTFVTLSSKLLNAAALRPQIEKYDRQCSTHYGDIAQTIRVSARDTSLLAQRLQSGVRRAREYQHEYCFSARDRRARYRHLKTGLTKRSRALKRTCKKPLLRIHKLTPAEIREWKRYIVSDFQVVHPDLAPDIKKACPLSKKLEIIREITPKYTKMTPRVPPIRIRAMPNGAMSVTIADRPLKVKTSNGHEPSTPPVVTVASGFLKPQKARKSFTSSSKFSSVEEIKQAMALKVQSGGVKRSAAFIAGRRRKKRRLGPKSQQQPKPKKDVNANPPLITAETDILARIDGKKLTREQRSLLRDECKELRSKGLSSLLLTEKGHVTRRMAHLSESPVPSESPVMKHLKLSPLPPASPLTFKQEAGEAMEKSMFYGSESSFKVETATCGEFMEEKDAAMQEDELKIEKKEMEEAEKKESIVKVIDQEMTQEPPIVSVAPLEIVSVAQSVAPLEIVSVAQSEDAVIVPPESVTDRSRTELLLHVENVVTEEAVNDAVLSNEKKVNGVVESEESTVIAEVDESSRNDGGAAPSKVTLPIPVIHVDNSIETGVKESQPVVEPDMVNSQNSDSDFSLVITSPVTYVNISSDSTVNTSFMLDGSVDKNLTSDSTPTEDGTREDVIGETELPNADNLKEAVIEEMENTEGIGFKPQVSSEKAENEPEVISEDSPIEVPQNKNSEPEPLEGVNSEIAERLLPSIVINDGDSSKSESVQPSVTKAEGKVSSESESALIRASPSVNEQLATPEPSKLSPQTRSTGPRVSPRQRKPYSPVHFVTPKLGRKSSSRASLELKRLQRDECKELKQKGLENLQVKNGRLTRARLKGPKE